MNTRLRAAVAYLATAAFFAVAALGQVQGDAIADSLVKAAVACVTVLVLGAIAISIVEAAAQRAANPAASQRPAPDADTVAPSDEIQNRAA